MGHKTKLKQQQQQKHTCQPSQSTCVYKFKQAAGNKKYEKARSVFSHLKARLKQKKYKTQLTAGVTKQDLNTEKVKKNANFKVHCFVLPY